MSWLTIRRGNAPLIVSLPHTGTDIPPEIESTLVSPWLSRKDADWHIEKLYDFASADTPLPTSPARGEVPGRATGDRQAKEAPSPWRGGLGRGDATATVLDATIIRTSISRTVIDVNRDPSGTSLYPGQATTELCPTTSFDGEPLYRPGLAPDEAEIAARRAEFFDPYHAALATEIARLKAIHPKVVLYDCHSIRSVIPRLFEGTLPNFNIGTNSGASCAPDLERAVTDIAAATGHPHVVNGRFKGGYITRHYADPENGVHTIQMELACRGYMPEPLGPVSPETWPSPYDPAYAQPMRDTLEAILGACLAFASSK